MIHGTINETAVLATISQKGYIHDMFKVGMFYQKLNIRLRCWLDDIAICGT